MRYREVAGAVTGGLTPLIAVALVAATGGRSRGVALFVIASCVIGGLAVELGPRPAAATSPPRPSTPSGTRPEPTADPVPPNAPLNPERPLRTAKWRRGQCARRPAGQPGQALPVVFDGDRVLDVRDVTTLRTGPRVLEHQLPVLDPSTVLALTRATAADHL
ncbi:hypothetical protein [Streptomyces antimycoticus]|uniref:hypothetical protein n=1 Tax=Streptomyces antimycoticus TaxID=68175 RepID=UPI003530C4E4